LGLRKRTKESVQLHYDRDDKVLCHRAPVISRVLTTRLV